MIYCFKEQLIYVYNPTYKQRKYKKHETRGQKSWTGIPGLQINSLEMGQNDVT
jgi:hypothetical protein